jgi:hypothetical protein
MADPVTLTVVGLAIAGAATSATVSAISARKQNQAISKAMKSQRSATTVQQKQLADAAGLEKLKRRREHAAILGRLRVASAEANVGFGGTFAALERQADFDLAANQRIIDENYRNQVALVRSGFEANIAQLESQVRNPVLDSVVAGIGGFQTGLSIGTGLDSAGAFNFMKPKTAAA